MKQTRALPLPQAIRLKPDFAEAHYSLSATLRGREGFDESEKAIGEARRLKPRVAAKPGRLRDRRRQWLR